MASRNLQAIPQGTAILPSKRSTRGPSTSFAAVRPISPSLTACDSALRKIMLSPEQARAFLDAAKGEQLGALYTVALSLGLRMGEALGLRWQDIDFERRVLTVNRILERIGRGQGSTLQLVEPKTSRSRRTVNPPV
jgi:integrase